MPRVLIVDDSQSARRVLTALMQEHGWTTTAAEDGARGAAAALSDPPDVVVSDLWMPGMSGLQLCRLLHEDPVTRKVPVVLLSASGDHRSRFWAARSGAAAFIDKGRAKGLPDILSSLYKARDRRNSRPPRAIRPDAIPNRLSELLDAALFDAVLSGELRALALKHADLRSLFAGMADLLKEVIAYGWCAMSVEPGVCLHVAAGEPGLPARAAQAIGAAGRRLYCVIEDDALTLPKRADFELVESSIEHAGNTIGRIALGMVGRPAPRDIDVLALVAREMALPLRLVDLLENTQRDAATDPLTGLANRRRGTEALAAATSFSERQGVPLVVAMVDLDYFKRVNDEHGHRAGDQTLRHVAAILRRMTRSADTLVRWGGDEFLLILPGTAMAGARVLADRVRVALASTPVELDEQTKLSVTASLGLVTWTAGETPNDLVGRADEALYAAKVKGRNRVEIAGAQAAGDE